MKNLPPIGLGDYCLPFAQTAVSCLVRLVGYRYFSLSHFLTIVSGFVYCKARFETRSKYHQYYPNFWLAYLSFFRLLNAHAGGQLWFFWLFQTTL